MTTCRSCDAEVLFVPSATTGKSMILDAKPSKGIVLLSETGLAESIRHLRPTAQLGGVFTAAVVDVYTDHHGTCPDAASWKGRRR